MAIWEYDQSAGRGGEPLKVKHVCHAWGCLRRVHDGLMFLDSSSPPFLLETALPQCWASEHLLKAVRQPSRARQENQALLMKAILGTRSRSYQSYQVQPGSVVGTFFSFKVK